MIMLKKLKRAMDLAYCQWNIGWNYNILQGTREVQTLDKRRTYFTQRLSAGSLGSKCKRKIFFSYHQVAEPKVNGEKQRLFNSGFVIENMIIANLIAAGIDVSAYNPENNNRQWEYTAYNNRVVSKLDGIFPNGIIEVPGRCNLEIKGVNDKKSLKFMQNGVQEEEEKYYAQMQIGMALSQTANCIFISMNKNNSKLHCELIPYDEEVATNLAKTAKKILDNPTLLPPKADDYCYNCDFGNVCRGGEVLKRCRTCLKYNWLNNTCKIDKHDCLYCEPTCDGKWELLEWNGEW